MHRSYDVELMKEATKLYSGFNSEGFDFEWWINQPHNVMFVEDDNVGLLTFEYPGVYTGHYFFKTGGRKGIDFAKRGIKEMFEKYGAEVIRGLTRTDNRPALWMNRHLGMVSQGVVETADGPHEIFCLTKQAFYERNNK